MRSSARQAIACIFALSSVAVVASAQTIPAKEPGATINGKVTIKGRGVPGVIVALCPNNQFRTGREFSGPKGVSDDEGNYQIVNVAPGNYRILPVARVFVPAEEADRERILIVNTSETIDHIDFALVRGGVITGKVLDAEWRPVVEEPVYLITLDENRAYYPPYNPHTDDRGVYRIYGLRPGRYKVAAGRGEDSFMVGPPRPYRRTFHPAVDDPSQAIIVEVTEGGETRDVDITFSRTVSTYTASGRIVDGETGQPLANIDYGLTRYQERGSSSRSGGNISNSRGEFKLTNLSPGKYGVYILQNQERDFRFRFEEVRFEIVDQDVTDLLIKATEAASISGVVVFEGTDDKAVRERLAAGMLISASIDEKRAASGGASAKVAGDGSFHLKGLAGGTAMISLYANGNIRVERIERDGVIQPRGIILKEPEHVKGIRVVAQFGTAALRGKIEVENGTLPADGRFYLRANRLGENSRSMYSGSNMNVQVDKRGQFAIEGMAAGTYEIDAGMYLTAEKMSYGARKQQVVVTAGTTTNLTITVDLSSTPIKQP